LRGGECCVASRSRWASDNGPKRTRLDRANRDTIQRASIPPRPSLRKRSDRHGYLTFSRASRCRAQSAPESNLPTTLRRFAISVQWDAEGRSSKTKPQAVGGRKRNCGGSSLRKIMPHRRQILRAIKIVGGCGRTTAQLLSPEIYSRFSVPLSRTLRSCVGHES
jgi:hypothetical protein